MICDPRLGLVKRCTVAERRRRVLREFRAFSTKANVLLVSLAAGDLLLILFTVPFQSTVYTFQSWPFGDGICKLGEFTVSLSLGVSVFTLTALSAERYIVMMMGMMMMMMMMAMMTLLSGTW